MRVQEKDESTGSSWLVEEGFLRDGHVTRSPETENNKDIRGHKDKERHDEGAGGNQKEEAKP